MSRHWIPNRRESSPAPPRRRPTGYGHPFVPAATIIELIDPLLTAYDHEAVARAIGITPRRLLSWRCGESSWVSFKLADQVVTTLLGRPELWLTVPELAEAYSQLGDAL